MEKINVIKVGGAVVEDQQQLSLLLKEFSAIEGRKVLVHGGGRRATKVASQLGIETQMVDGRRITDKAMLEVVTMVYGGLVNKNVVAQLQAEGINALGLTGADINVIRSHKRPLKNGIDYGFVGDVDHADGNMLKTLIEAGIVPVMAPLTHDGKGNMLNTNADTIASSVASALGAELVTCFEKRGVLRDKDDDDSVIAHINPESFERMKQEGSISDGMIPKLQNAFKALREGAVKVTIKHSSELLSDSGTVISL